MSHLGSLQVERLSIVTEKHDVFLQVTQASVLMVTNSFLMQILDKTEESGGGWWWKYNNHYLVNKA